MDQYFCAKTWTARKMFLWLSFFLGVFAWSLPLILTVTRGKGEDPVEVCLLWARNWGANGIVKLHSENLREATFAFTIWCSMLVAAYIYLYCYYKQCLVSDCINKPLRPVCSTLAFGVTTLLALVPSAFKNHTIESYGVSFLVLFWGFTLQMFLQPKTDFGLFTCISSSVLTILTGFVQCQPRNIGDLICFGGFFVIVGLYYYYTSITYNPTREEVHFRSRALASDSISLRLRCLGSGEDDERIKRNLTSNELYHVQFIRQRRDFNLYHLVPSSSIDLDTKNYLLDKNPTDNHYLSEYYIIEGANDQPITRVEQPERIQEYMEEVVQSTRSRTLSVTSMSEAGT